jgi:hypothetical protein
MQMLKSVPKANVMAKNTLVDQDSLLQSYFGNKKSTQ